MQSNEQPNQKLNSSQFQMARGTYGIKEKEHQNQKKMNKGFFGEKKRVNQQREDEILQLKGVTQERLREIQMRGKKEEMQRLNKLQKNVQNQNKIQPKIQLTVSRLQRLCFPQEKHSSSKIMQNPSQLLHQKYQLYKLRSKPLHPPLQRIQSQVFCCNPSRSSLERNWLKDLLSHLYLEKHPFTASSSSSSEKKSVDSTSLQVFSSSDNESKKPKSRTSQLGDQKNKQSAHIVHYSRQDDKQILQEKSDSII